MKINFKRRIQFDPKYIALLLVAIVALVAFKPNTEPNADFKTSVLKSVDEVIAANQKLGSILEKNDKDEESILKAYFQLRKEFKEVECVLAHTNHSFYLKFLNGAPLPKLQQNVPDHIILQPQGLQVMDERIIDVYENRKDLIEYSNQLDVHLKDERLFCVQARMTDEFISYSIQFGLLRTYTQGITGFDTPGTLHGIEDAANTFNGILDLIQSWKPASPEIKVALERNISFLTKNNNFEKFDRLEYYKEYWQPVYSNWVSINSDLNLTSWDDINQRQMEVNIQTDQLFASNFLQVAGFLDFDPNDINAKTVELGKQLFFDPFLSGSGSMSCGTCHNPEKGFSDGLPKSRASDGISHVQRNSPGLVNAIFSKGFFYDLRAEHLSQQFEHVIFSDQEFNTTFVDVLNKLHDSEYRDKFIEAFPIHSKKPVNPYTFKTALSAYLTTLVGYNSTFDRHMRGEEAKLSSSAKRGFNLFMGKAACATCHFPPTFAGLVPPYFDDSETEVLGVPEDKEYAKLDSDLGRYNLQKIKEAVDFYKNSFKTTTVRNSSLTAPYMHNGVFETYEEVLEFYNNGGGAGHGLNVPYQTLAGDSLNLSKKDQKDLISFMKSLEYNP